MGLELEKSEVRSAPSRRERRRARARRRLRQAAISGGSLLLLLCAVVLALKMIDSGRGDVADAASGAAPRLVVPSTPFSPAARPVHRLDLRVDITTTTTSPYPALPPNAGAGRRVVYCNSCQRVWLVDEHEKVILSYLVSGRRGVPNPGTYHVHRKLVNGWHKTLRLPYFVGFAFGSTTDIGFHGIPLRSNGSPIQSDSELGQYRSLGCARQNQGMARILFEWSRIGDTVVVTR
jgi:hypothetical protein